MAKVRLNNYHRRKLNALAKEKVQVDKNIEKKEYEFYKKAKPVVLKAVRNRYPVRDMNVLKKYEKAYPDKCIKLVDLDDPEQDVTMFQFEEKHAPLVAKQTWCSPPYEISKKDMKVVKEWRTVYDECKNHVKEKLDAYRTLIQSSRYLEDVIAVWPEAEELRKEIDTKNHSVIPASIIQTIQDDVKTRIKNNK